MAKKKKAAINLLVRAGFADTTAGRLLAWILTSFRIIVIVTEILVMLAFLSRFWLDAQNTDLDEEIKQKQAVLAASIPFEQKFKDTQARLKVFSNYTEGGGKNTQSLSFITTSIPPDILLSSIRLSGVVVEIKGVSPSERSIQQFLVNLEAHENLGDITLGEITESEAGLLLFDLDIRSKPTEGGK